MNHQRIIEQMRERAVGRRSNRRTFVFGAAASAAGVAARQAGARMQGMPLAAPAFSDTPFTLGVASGEPLPDGVVIWTRLAPLPFESFGGMPLEPVDVRWMVAEDESFATVVRQGTAVATPDWGHSVHVEVGGLRPNRWYWYQFVAGQEVSPVGRTRTAPAPGSPLDGFRFAFASCQRWDHGLYTAYRDMARQDIDLIVHLGDYIYESRIGDGASLRSGAFPSIAFSEPRDLEGYRYRYALYKLDPHLQEAHRIAPWLVTWDDHEVYDNFFGAMNREDAGGEMLLARRAAAYQAYYEHQPLRREAIPAGPDLQLYRRRQFGDLVEFNVLDTRQYRTYQGLACGDRNRIENGGFCPASLEAERTMLGARQKQWLLDGFNATSARWNVLAQQVPMSRIDNDASPETESFGDDEMDTWDGYAVERDEIVSAMGAAAQARSFNPVVITGDVHANYVWDLKSDWDDGIAESIIGTEFVGTSISSYGDEAIDNDGEFTTECGNRNGNAHNHLFDNHRGYVLCTLSPHQWRADYRVLPTVKDERATASTLTSFVVEHGRPGAQLAGVCVNASPDS